MPFWIRPKKWTIYPEGLDYEEKQEYDFEKYYEEAYG